MPVEGVALEHVAAVLEELAHPEGARSDGPGVERDVVRPEPGLRVEALGLLGNRREERHREPVGELRILAAHADAQRPVVRGLDARERQPHEIKPGVLALLRALLRPALAQRLGVLAQADDALAHGAEDRAHHARACDAADAAGVVARGEFARARLREVEGAAHARGLLLGKTPVERPAGRVLREARVRGVADPRTDADLVARLGDERGIGVLGKLLARGVVVARPGDRLRGPRLENVGALQVCVLVGRLENRVGVGGLVSRIGALRIERPRASRAEGREDRVRCVLLERPRA